MKQYLAGSVAYNTPENHVPAPIFRRKFFCENAGGSSLLKISSTGFYRLFLNGKELTKGYFAPYIANPDELVYYDEYTLGNDLKRGENELFVLLGNGFTNSNDGDVWNFETASYRSAPKFSLEITLDGMELLCSDENFEVCDSPILFDDYRNGEHYDARNEGTAYGGLFSGKNLRKPILAEPPKGEERRCEAQPIKAFERIEPISVNAVKGGYIYDFGVNFAGVAEVNIVAEEGQEIDLTFGEVLQNGELDIRNITFGGRSREGYVQRDLYICKQGSQTWKPCFTYHGFRYVYVRGITEKQATKGLLTYVVLHSDIPERGKFSCGNDTLNKIQECTVRSDLSNFHYFPTDCPHREKNGWTGDAALSAEQLLYNFDCEASLREWLVNIRKAQRENGSIPGIVPTGGWGLEWGNGPAWDDALVEITYQLYRFGGDRKVIEENAEAIAKYVGYLNTKINDNGLIGFGLGDWLEAEAPSPDRYSTPLEVSDTLTSIELLREAAEMQSVIGRTAEAEKSRSLEKLLADNFKKIHIKNSVVDCETQTSQAMAMRLNLFEDDGAAYSELKRIIERDGRFKVGILGVKRLFDCMCDHGDGETALKMLTDDKHPGYAHNLLAGATTLWEDLQIYDLSECQNSLVRKDGGGILSLNHHCWGSVSAWFFKRLAGIEIKSPREVEIKPCFVKGLSNAEAEFTRGGRYIYAKWERTDKGIILTVENKGFRGKVIAGEATELKEGKSEYVIPETK